MLGLGLELVLSKIYPIIIQVLHGSERVACRPTFFFNYACSFFDFCITIISLLWYHV